MTFDTADKKALHELFEDCTKAQKLSYSPYSNFRVGACIYTADGKKIYGANIENSSYGLSMCAERTAMFEARLQGYKPEEQLVLGIKGDSSTYAYPCGACRQVMLELLTPQTPVVIFSQSGEAVISTVAGLMPYYFTKENLK